MDPWQIATVIFGVGLDLLGVTLTGVGLFFTWRDHALGEEFFPAMWSEVKELARRLARRPRSVVVHGATATGTIEFSGHAHGVVGLRADATVEERIGQLKEELDRVSGAVAKAQHEAEQARKLAAKYAQELGERLDRLDEDVRDRLREQTLRGLPLAILGLMLTGVGTAIQLAATIAG